MPLPPPAGHLRPPPETPLVSCLLTVSRAGPELAAAMADFDAQTYAQRELIVVDDGAEPSGWLIREHPRIRHIRLDRPHGWYEKLTIGARGARGELVATWEADALYQPWRLEYQVAGMLAEGFEISGRPDLLSWDPQARTLWRRTRPEGLAAAGCLLARRHLLGGGVAMLPNPGGGRYWLSAGGPFQVPAEATYCVVREDPAGEFADGGEQVSGTTALLEELARRFTPSGSARRRLAPRGPAVTCVMPTYDRPEFVSRAVDYFLLQDYATCELVVLDDGAQPVEQLIPSDPRVRYVRMQGRATTGAKRNLGCQLADGELILNWDDDDWYGRHRISHQLAPLLAGTADAAAIVRSLILELDPLVFWVRDNLPAGELTISPETVSAGTMAYSKRLWSACGGYGDQGRFEDSGFMMRLLEQGARIQAADNPGVFAYIRHRHNSFARIDMDYQPQGWRPIPRPDFFPPGDLAFYAGVARARATT